MIPPLGMDPQVCCYKDIGNTRSNVGFTHYWAHKLVTTKKNPDIGARPSVVLGAYCVDVNCKFPQVCCRCMLQNVASEVGGEAKQWQADKLKFALIPAKGIGN